MMWDGRQLRGLLESGWRTRRSMSSWHIALRRLGRMEMRITMSQTLRWVLSRQRGCNRRAETLEMSSKASY